MPSHVDGFEVFVPLGGVLDEVLDKARDEVDGHPDFDTPGRAMLQIVTTRQCDFTVLKRCCVLATGGGIMANRWCEVGMMVVNSSLVGRSFLAYRLLPDASCSDPHEHEHASQITLNHGLIHDAWPSHSRITTTFLSVLVASRLMLAHRLLSYPTNPPKRQSPSDPKDSTCTTQQHPGTSCEEAWKTLS